MRQRGEMEEMSRRTEVRVGSNRGEGPTATGRCGIIPIAAGTQHFKAIAAAYEALASALKGQAGYDKAPLRARNGGVQSIGEQWISKSPIFASGLSVR